jgi:hypothetical protein
VGLVCPASAMLLDFTALKREALCCNMCTHHTRITHNRVHNRITVPALGLSMVVQRLIDLERRAGAEERARLAARVRELEGRLGAAGGAFGGAAAAVTAAGAGDA